MSKKKQKAEKIDPTEDFKLMIFLESSTITKDSVGDQIEESKYCPSEGHCSTVFHNGRQLFILFWGGFYPGRAIHYYTENICN